MQYFLLLVYMNKLDIAPLSKMIKLGSFVFYIFKFKLTSYEVSASVFYVIRDLGVILTCSIGDKC